MKQPRRGFTLIELVVTVAIIGILASITVPLAELTIRRTKEAELRSSLRQIRGAIDAYKKAADESRIAKEATESGYPKTLNELVLGVPDLRNPGEGKIYFLRRLPRDPFQTDQSISAEKTWAKRSYKSPPDKPQEGADVFDVYSRSNDTGLNGVPYREW